MDKITLENFYNVYGISLLADKIDKDILLKILLPIANKYVDVTYQACDDELDHLILGNFDYFSDGISDWTDKMYKRAIIHHQKLLIELNIISWKDNLTFKQMEILFKKGMWDENYGGESWGKIAETGYKLERAIQRKHLKHILAHIDHLNDMEHNNDLYLRYFTTFPHTYSYECNIKSNATPEVIFSKCSTEILILNNKSQSIVAQFH